MPLRYWPFSCSSCVSSSAHWRALQHAVPSAWVLHPRVFQGWFLFSSGLTQMCVLRKPFLDHLAQQFSPPPSHSIPTVSFIFFVAPFTCWGYLTHICPFLLIICLLPRTQASPQVRTSGGSRASFSLWPLEASCSLACWMQGHGERGERWEPIIVTSWMWWWWEVNGEVAEDDGGPTGLCYFLAVQS